MNELSEYKEMREAIARVRELHKPVEFISERKVTYTVCEYCTDLVNNPMAICLYPCSTIKALDGEQ